MLSARYTDLGMSTDSLAGKTVLVTGGARRLGRVIALTLAQAGADVAITFRNSQQDAAQTAADVAALGRNSLAVPCDVRSESSVRAAVLQVMAGLGQIDILVNNAAVFGSAALESLTLDQWDAAFETNTRGPFLVAREALPHLRAARGRIVNMGSLGGFHAWAGHAHYCASKAALHMLTQAMAKAFAPDVSVNCVAPGWIEMKSPDSSGNSGVPHPDSELSNPEPGVPRPSFAWAGSDLELAATPLTEAERRTEIQSARFAAKTPMGRNGNAQDVAEAVLFFATGPHFITGQTLVVDGGLGLN